MIELEAAQELLERGEEDSRIEVTEEIDHKHSSITK
jgi:hypothetical protein